jgi:hypothetical protein
LPSIDIGSDHAHRWRQRLLQEAGTRNLTHLHVRILTGLEGLLEAGTDQPTHQALAELAGASLAVVKDALKRARQLGLVQWDQQFVARGGQRRQIANRYWITLPLLPAVARPEVRRHRKLVAGVQPPSKQGSYTEPVHADAAAALARRRAVIEARLLGNRSAGGGGAPQAPDVWPS